jgi:signal transduction histidine kinase
LLIALAFVYLPLYFPDGRLPSRRWLPVAVITGIGALIIVVLGMLSDTLRGQNVDYRIENPIGIEGLAAVEELPVFGVLGVPLVIGCVGAVAAVIVRFRRSSGVERQQMKWFLYATAPILTFPVTDYLPGIVSDLVFGWMLIGLPTAIGIAVFRYRLYDIDVVINRTLVYGALSACVVSIYVFAVVALGALFQAQGNLAVSLSATGLVAVLFQPLRSRLQRSVNRLMYGERDEPYAVISRLGKRLEAALDPEAVLPTVVETIAQALKLPYAAILLKEGEGFRTAAAYGSPRGEPETLPLVYQREEVGRLVLSPRAPGEGFSDADRSLLEDLARQAEVAVHAVRLTSDLQHSRERLVATREEERRRLRRDLHDGLGAQLAGLNVQAGALRRLIPRDPDAAEEVVVELRHELRSAIADIRRLVYDLRPPALDDLGLVESLRQLAQRYSAKDEPLRVLVEVPDHLPNLPAAVEVAVYRITQEALTNVARHARARSCVVRLVVDEDVALEIVDVGVGIPEERSAGVGLSSMHERASELGGSCVIRSVPNGGTQVLVHLPLPKE